MPYAVFTGSWPARLLGFAPPSTRLGRAHDVVGVVDARGIDVDEGKQTWPANTLLKAR